jgi:hypothetical protein
MDIFILAASLTVMNMLIGVLCEVVSAVAASEREENSLHMVMSKVQKIFFSMGLDEDNNGMISKEEFRKIVENREAARAINDLGVDVIELVDMADFFFALDYSDTEYAKEFSFAEFMDMVVQLRGSNTATVKDIMLLRKFITVELQGLKKTSRGLDKCFGSTAFGSTASITKSKKLSLGIGGDEDTNGSCTTSPKGIQKPFGRPSYESSPEPPELPPMDLALARPPPPKCEQPYLPSQDPIHKVAKGESRIPRNIPGAPNESRLLRSDSNETIDDLC